MLAPETVTFLEGGCALIVGTVSTSGEPHATRGWGVTVLSDDPLQVRLVLGADDTVGLEHLSTSAKISVTGADVLTLRSIQFKGTALGIEPATDEDRARASQFCDAFFGDVMAIDGTPRELMEHLVPSTFVAARVLVTEMYDQTPGPGAGASMPGGTS